jgi:hypothetical protein
MGLEFHGSHARYVCRFSFGIKPHVMKIQSSEIPHSDSLRVLQLQPHPVITESEGLLCFAHEVLPNNPED